MSTIAEVEAAIAKFSPEELRELERFLRMRKREREARSSGSVFDLAPLDLGKMLRPLGDREEWYDEMLAERV